MKAKMILTGLALVLAAPLLMAAPSGAAWGGTLGKAAAAPELRELPGVEFNESFEKTTQPWVAGSNDRSLPASISRQIGDNGCGDGGQAYATLSSQPVTDMPEARSQRPDPIMTWAAIPLASGGGPVDVDVEWTSRSQRDCEGCIPAVYVGTQAPTDSSHFRMIPQVITKQWQTYAHQANLHYGNTETVYVAIGWMGSSAAIALDCVSITIQPRYDYSFGFEAGVEPWELVDVNRIGGILDQAIGDAGCSKYDTQKGRHAALRNYWGPQGSPGSGAESVPVPLFHIMQTGLPPSGDQFSDVTIKWSTRNEYGCAGCNQFIYVGTSPITGLDQLRPLATRTSDYWQNMGYQSTIPTWGANHIYVALAWQEPEIAQRPRAVGYDCVNVHIEPSDLLP